MTLAIVLIAALVVAPALADCPNACSGHGLCGTNDECLCDPTYVGGDCSQRTCPWGSAFVDTPRGDLNHNGQIDTDTAGYVPVPWSYAMEHEFYPLATNGAPSTTVPYYSAAVGEAHFWQECSGKGVCDRTAGDCTCYAGYTGAACQRTTCPNDCNGNGVCRTLREVASGARNTQKIQSFAGHSYFSGVVNDFDYNLWDADKKQLCLCDPGYGGIDCSNRLCPRGADPLLKDIRWCGGTSCQWEIQSFTLQKTGPTTYSFSLTDALNVTHVALATVDTAGNTLNGYVDPTSAAFANSLPDPTSTIAGQIMAALRATPAGLLQQVEVWPAAAVGTSPQDLTFRVTFVGVPGNQEMLAVSVYSGPGGLTCDPDGSTYTADTAAGSCAAGSASSSVTSVTVGNRPETECASRGTCDYTKGLCKCFSGFIGAACEYQNALAALPSSASS